MLLKSLLFIIALAFCDIYISSDGHNEDGCGTKDNACQGLLYAFQNVNDSKFIYLDGSYDDETGIAVLSDQIISVFGETGTSKVKITPVLNNIYYYISLNNAQLAFSNATVTAQDFVTNETNFASIFCVVAGQLNITAVSFAGITPSYSFFVHGDPASTIYILNITVVNVTVLKYGHIIHVRDISLPLPAVTKSASTHTSGRGANALPASRARAHARSNAFAPYINVSGSNFTDVIAEHTQAGVFFAYISGSAALVEAYKVVVENVAVSGLRQRLVTDDLGDVDLNNDGEVISVVLRVLFEWTAEGRSEGRRANANAGSVEMTNVNFTNNSVVLIDPSNTSTAAPAPSPTRAHARTHTRTLTRTRTHTRARTSANENEDENGSNPFFVVPWPLALVTVTGQPGAEGPSFVLSRVTIANSSTYKPPQLGCVALHVSGGVVTIADDVRIGGNEVVPWQDYPSYRQNIACYGSATLKFNTWNGVPYDPAQNQSLWIDGINGHCEIDGPYRAVLSPLCVPVLRNATLIKGKDGTGWEAYGTAILYTGQTLFPLNATFEIYEVNSSSSGKEELTTFPVNGFFPPYPPGMDPVVVQVLSTLKESQCGAYVDPDILAQITASPNEWRARMWFGVNKNNDSGDYLPTAFLGTAYYTIRAAPVPQAAPKKKANGGAIAAAVIIPLVVVGVIVGIVVVVVLWRRRNVATYTKI